MAIVRNASILFVCTMAGNIANYCFQFIMGRHLSIEDFGTMNALLSVSTSITLPTGAVMIVIAKYASTYKVMDDSNAMSALYSMALRKVTAAAGLVTGAFVLLSGLVGSYMNITDTAAVLILAVGIFGSFMLTVNLGMLQGMQRFYYLGAGIGLGGVLRLALGGVALVLGYRLNGALVATVLPSLLIFALTVPALSVHLSGKTKSFRHERLLSYSIPVLIASSAFAFLSNIDLVMVKHYLTPREAGLYASVAVLGKTMLYLPSSFALAVFPMVSEAYLQDGDSYKILDRSLLCTALICAAGLAVFALFPELIMRMLFGSRFAGASGFLKYYGVAMASMAVLSILMSFNLARGRTGFIYSLAGGSALTVAVISVFHGGILEVMVATALVFAALTTFNLWLVYREKRIFHRKRSYAFVKPEAGNTD